MLRHLIHTAAHLTYLTGNPVQPPYEYPRIREDCAEQRALLSNAKSVAAEIAKQDPQAKKSGDNSNSIGEQQHDAVRRIAQERFGFTFV